MPKLLSALFSCGLACAVALVAPAAADEAGDAGTAPSARRIADWQVEGSIGGANDLSGIACTTDRAPSNCLVASDELRSVQCVRLGSADPGSPRRILAGRTINLFGSGDELDAEGIAYSDGYYYVVGSHALSRKQKLQPNRFHVVRVAADACAQPQAARPPHAPKIVRGSLTASIRDQPELAPFLHRALDENGINIEGIAVFEKRFYFGFRSPSVDGRVPVVSVAANAQAPSRWSTAEVLWLALGDDIGVRDLARVSDGLLVLVGNSSTAADPRVPADSRAAVLHWRPGAAATRLSALPASVAKPEAMLLLAEDAAEYRILILSDSAPNGSPVEYAIPTTAAAELRERPR